MPRLPEWLVLSVGVIIMVFGLFRLRLAVRSKAAQEAAARKGGLFAFPRRTHGLFALVYILMGVLLIAGGLGLKMPWMR